MGNSINVGSRNLCSWASVAALLTAPYGAGYSCAEFLDRRDAWEGVRMERGEHWERVARTSAFQELMQRKKKFIIPATIFFLVFYLGLPVLAGFTTILNATVVGALTWAYVYAFAQFAMTWTVLHLYVSQANKWDDIVDGVRREAADEPAQREEG